jgi:hypothetical protein
LAPAALQLWVRTLFPGIPWSLLPNLNAYKKFIFRIAALAGWGTEVFTTSGSYTWVPIIGPFVGAALAGLIYELFIDSHSNRTRLTHRKI